LVEAIKVLSSAEDLVSTNLDLVALRIKLNNLSFGLNSESKVEPEVNNCAVRHWHESVHLEFRPISVGILGHLISKGFPWVGIEEIVHIVP
jgi:hypothetical protein